MEPTQENLAIASIARFCITIVDKCKLIDYMNKIDKSSARDTLNNHEMAVQYFAKLENEIYKQLNK